MGTVGYRTLKVAALRIPILEKVSWMDLNTIPPEVSVTNAYSKGLIRSMCRASPTSRCRAPRVCSRTPPNASDATEQIGQIAKETLEANLWYARHARRPRRSTRTG